MKSTSEKILARSNFKGGYSIDFLPTFIDSRYPHNYLIFVDASVFFAVVVHNENTATVFNCARQKIVIPPELVYELSHLYNVTLLNCDITVELDHMFGISLFFLYFCIDNLALLPIIFPPKNSHYQHYCNVHDFLKVHDPINFNKW